MAPSVSITLETGESVASACGVFRRALLDSTLNNFSFRKVVCVSSQSVYSMGLLKIFFLIKITSRYLSTGNSTVGAQSSKHFRNKTFIPVSLLEFLSSFLSLTYGYFFINIADLNSIRIKILKDPNSPMSC
jgi:hypothetical protein